MIEYLLKLSDTMPFRVEIDSVFVIVGSSFGGSGASLRVMMEGGTCVVVYK